MKNKSKIKSIILAIGIIFVLFTINNYNNINNQDENEGTIENKNDPNFKRLKKSGYWSISFIHIDGNIPGNWTATLAKPWCNIVNGRYVIENVTIDASSSPTGSGIFINNSKNDYFVIRNCTIFNAGSGSYNAGIRMENTNHGRLINNNCSNNFQHGIVLDNGCNNNNISGNTANDNMDFGIWLNNQCDNNTISGNTANGNSQGIQIFNQCHNNTLSGNNANDNSAYGICLNNCDDTTISGNIASNKLTTNQIQGIYLSSGCDNSIILGNTANNNNQRGIFLNTQCDNTIILGNSANGNIQHGIYLYNGCNNNTISGNSANGNSLRGIYLDTDCYNNTISGNTANDNVEFGIYLTNNCYDNTISGNTANNNITTDQNHGIYLNNECDNCIISGNTANDNIDYGIFLNNCDNNTILGNTVNNNIQRGINLYNGCNNNTISGNTAKNNSAYGIFLNNCDDNTISGNTANDNGAYGICLYNLCNNNTISGNIANDNIDYGIWINFKCDNNTIMDNFVFENSVGIQLEADCLDNILFYNYIFNNSNNNGFDSGSNNWDNGVIGNYWDDYIGIDADYDGIGDTPYVVPGGIGNKDNYPIMLYKVFFFESPGDLTYEVGTMGYNIKWIVINPSPLLLTFNVYRDGTSVKTGHVFPLRKNEIVTNVDGLYVGAYGFTIEVADGNCGIFSDGAWVTVTNTAPVFTTTPDDFTYEVGSSGNNISWTFSDVSTNNPTYTINRNGMPITINNPCISGEIIEISVDGLDVGSYGFTIEINDGYGATALDSVWVSVKSGINLLYVEIIDQLFSKEDFNVTFVVYNEKGQGIDSATIQMWWNGTDVSDNVADLGNGIYCVSLEPITVAPGDDPILLNMVISVSEYEDRHFETYLMVDPETLEKRVDRDGGEFPFMITIITIISAAGGIGATIITIGILRKRKGISEVK